MRCCQAKTPVADRLIGFPFQEMEGRRAAHYEHNWGRPTCIPSSLSRLLGHRPTSCAMDNMPFLAVGNRVSRITKAFAPYGSFCTPMIRKFGPATVRYASRRGICMLHVACILHGSLSQVPPWRPNFRNFVFICVNTSGDIQGNWCVYCASCMSIARVTVSASMTRTSVTLERKMDAVCKRWIVSCAIAW